MKKKIYFTAIFMLLFLPQKTTYSQTTCSYNWSLIGNAAGVNFNNAVAINSHDQIFVGTESQYVFTKKSNSNPDGPWSVLAWQLPNPTSPDPSVVQILVNSKDYIFVRAIDMEYSYPYGVRRSKDNGFTWDDIISNYEYESTTSIEVSLQDGFYFTDSYTGCWISNDDGDTFESPIDWENAPDGFDWCASNVAANNDRWIVENVYSHSVYYGTEFIKQFSWSNFRIKKFDINSTGQLFVTFYDSTGIYFADTTGKYSTFKKRGLENFNYDEINKILIDRKDRVYVGTDSGLYFSNNNGQNWYLLGLSDYRIDDVSINPKGNLAVMCYNNDSTMPEEVYFGEKEVTNHIVVIAPSDATLKIQRGSEYDIHWQSSGNIGDKVKVELYKDGTYDRTIQIETENDGFYTWQVPLPLSVSLGSNYQIKITSIDDPSIYDYGDKFSIIAGSYEDAKAVYNALEIPSGLVPTLDGYLYDTIWGYIKEDTLKFTGTPKLNPDPWTNYSDVLVTWKAAWSKSENKLYVGVTVHDDVRSTFDNGPSSANYLPYNDDAIELFIDGDHSGGDALLEYANSQQFRVTGDNHRDFFFYPNKDYTTLEYTGDDFISYIQQGTGGNWTCEAVFNIYNSYSSLPKTLVKGDTIGWDIWYDDSDDNDFNGTYYKLEHQVGWFFRGLSWKNADFLGALVLGDEPENMAVQDKDALLTPDKFEITNGYPNPFNSETMIKISLPENSRVLANVYDIQGRRIKELVNTQLSAGYHSLKWDGSDDRGNSVPSGVYLIKIKANNNIKTMKVVLQK